MVFLIVVIIIALILIWFIASYNGFVKLKNKSQEAFSAMDVMLKKRYDLIPNMVEVVKGYAKHEKSAFENVIKARNAAINSVSPDEVIFTRSPLYELPNEKERKNVKISF